MQIKRLVIENFKSIERIELVEPNPFTVFVGPNGSGKSNIFEALEFGHRILASRVSEAVSLFGGADAIIRRAKKANSIFRSTYAIGTDDGAPGEMVVGTDLGASNEFEIYLAKSHYIIADSYYRRFPQFTHRFYRIALYEKEPRINFQGESSLNTAASNLEPVLKRILADSTLSEEMYEWMSLFVPGFQSVDVVSGSLDGKDTLLLYEQGVEKPFTKNLISDGTYNILAMLTAVYQSDDKPQFLCIEEPENGLHPQVARELVDFFRTMCEERGHYIWLNTHSPYMVSRVRPEELVVVDKVNGATQVKQFKGQEFDGMRMDEAWLTNALNGGKAW